MNKEQINARINQIIEEYAQLSEMEFCEPPQIELLNEKGDMRVTIVGITQAGRKKIAERIIEAKETLEWISDTFHYPSTLYFGSKKIHKNSVICAYINIQDNLIIEHKDGSVELFKIKSDQKNEIINKLKIELGDILKT